MSKLRTSSEAKSLRNERQVSETPIAASKDRDWVDFAVAALAPRTSHEKGLLFWHAHTAAECKPHAEGIGRNPKGVDQDSHKPVTI